jgi:hypothetical protein
LAVAPGTSPGPLIEAVERWKHLTAMTQSAQEDILTKSKVWQGLHFLENRQQKRVGLTAGCIFSVLVYKCTLGDTFLLGEHT